MCAEFLGVGLTVLIIAFAMIGGALAFYWYSELMGRGRGK
jgi:hypothetical protein